jgi:hypothetical protein
VDRIATVAIDHEVTVSVGECMLPLDAVPRAWFYVTKGLEQLGQREVVMVLRIGAGDRAADYHDDPIRFLSTLHHLLGGGQATFDADYTFNVAPGTGFAGGEVGGFTLTEMPDWTSLPWVNPHDYQREPLVVMALPTAEMRVLTRFGAPRLLTLLGLRTRTYPHPWWFDASRAPVADYDAYAQATIAAGAPMMSLPVIEVVRNDRQFQVMYEAVGGPWLHNTLSNAPSVGCLVPRIAQSAQALSVWQPGQQGPAAIGPDGSDDHHLSPSALTIGLNFLMFVHGDVDRQARAVEDGLAVTMTERDWRQLLKSLAAAEPFTWKPGRDGTEVRFQPMPAGF